MDVKGCSPPSLVKERGKRGRSERSLPILALTQGRRVSSTQRVQRPGCPHGETLTQDLRGRQMFEDLRGGAINPARSPYGPAAEGGGNGAEARAAF